MLSSIKSEGNAPDFLAVKALAQHAAGNTSDAVTQIEPLVEKELENATVQLLGGTVLQAAGKTEEALALLSRHQGSLEAYDRHIFRDLCFVDEEVIGLRAAL